MQKLLARSSLFAPGFGAFLFSVCVASPAPAGQISQAPFGVTPDGTPVTLYTLKNASGLEAKISDLGGILVSLKTPDRTGKPGEVALGYDTLDPYIHENSYMGAMVGRYANRIAGASFTLDGHTYKLAANNGPNSLHGGKKGFNNMVWHASTSVSESGPTLELTYLSKDGEEGFPGNLQVKAVYSLTADNALRLEYTATTDKPTVVNLSQHSYFNLAGRGEVLDHQFLINAAKFTPVDDTLIPTGELRPVAGTPFDFRQPTTLGTRISLSDPQLKIGHGFDHNFVVDKPAGQLGLMARITEPTTGRVMEVLSTEPGVQFYTADFSGGGAAGHDGWKFQGRASFCLECEHFPGSPSHPEFPSTVLRPGTVFHSVIEYRFPAIK